MTTVKPKLLLALWAKEVARKGGYTPKESMSLGLGFSKTSATDFETGNFIHFLGEVVAVQGGKQTLMLSPDGEPYLKAEYTEQVRNRFPSEAVYKKIRRLYRDVLDTQDIAVLTECGGDLLVLFEAMQQTCVVDGKAKVSAVYRWCEAQMQPTEPPKRKTRRQKRVNAHRRAVRAKRAHAYH